MATQIDVVFVDENKDCSLLLKKIFLLLRRIKSERERLVVSIQVEDVHRLEVKK